MDISYKKDGQQKYMIIRDVEFEESDYKLQMILNNHIDNFVPLTIRNINNQMEIWYDTTSLVSADSVYSKKLMNGSDVLNFIRVINKLAENIKEYLLDINNILFSMDFIFITREEKKYRFCWNPNNEGYFQEKLRMLFDELLEYIDHNDKKAVMICYGIQQITIGDDFTIGDLLEFANKTFNYEEPKIADSDVVDICYGEGYQSASKKESIFQRLKKFIGKDNRYTIADELDKSYGFVQEECDFDEERTVLLTSSLENDIVLKSINQEQELTIKPREFPCIIGSSAKSTDVCLKNSVISRVHLRISKEIEDYYIEDLNSTNGTFINEERIKAHEPKRIEIGDIITIANLQFMVE